VPNIPREKGVFLQIIGKVIRLYLEELWVLDSDFNLISSLDEKMGGFRCMDVEMEAFRDIIMNLPLVDMLTDNGMYTWNDRCGGTHQVTSCLD